MWFITSIDKKKFKISKLGKYSLEVFSATVWGTISTTPQRSHLRCIFICYLLYHIHIQTGFTSNLATILTTPQFEHGITNFEELAEANITIYASFFHYLAVTGDYSYTNTFLELIKSKTKPISPMDMENRNYSDIIIRDNNAMFFSELQIKHLRRDFLRNTRINVIDASPILKTGVTMFAFPEVASYENEQLDSCVTRAIEEIFKIDDALVFVYDEIVDLELPIIIPNTYVIVRSNKPTRLRFDKRTIFIIHLSSQKTIINTFSFLINTSFWTNKESIKSGFLFIINETDLSNLSNIFQVAWSMNIHKVAIITHGAEDVKVHTADPFHKGNECGNIAKVIRSQFCNNTLSVTFTNIYRDLNKCSIIFLTYDDDYSHPLFKYFFKIFNELAKKVKGEFIPKYYYTEMKLNSTKSSSLNIFLENENLRVFNKNDVSQVALNNNFYFIVNGRQIIPPMKILFLIFTIDVWVLILIAFLATSIALWLITSIRKNELKISHLFKILMDVFVATFWGCFPTVPKQIEIRCIFISYVIYQMHIQTGFSSNLATVLTTPQFHRGITSLEELANAKIPVYIDILLKSYFKMEDNCTNSIYNKIKNKVQFVNIVNYEDFAELITKENCAMLITEFDLKHLRYKTDGNTQFNRIDASMILGKFQTFFILPPGNYFTKTFNLFILSMEESGILSKNFNTILDEVKTEPEHKYLVPLNIKHLLCAFVLLTFSLVLSIFVFMLEVLLHK
ncbi:hypothetical protein FQR65_LT08055 [Abscondita terminalis]|nr:hypothetical protein FQR65_LT08055 [Abscondita terminalis]